MFEFLNEWKEKRRALKNNRKFINNVFAEGVKLVIKRDKEIKRYSDIASDINNLETQRHNAVKAMTRVESHFIEDYLDVSKRLGKLYLDEMRIKKGLL